MSDSHSESKIHTDDPRLTAYVLGELDADERAAVEAHLTECADSRAAVDELRQVTSTLFAAMQSEPVATLSDAQRQAIHSAALHPEKPSTTARRPSVRVVSHTSGATSGRGWMAVLTASACLAILIGVSVYEHPAPESRLGDIPNDRIPMLAMTDHLGRDSRFVESLPADQYFDLGFGREGTAGLERRREQEVEGINEVQLRGLNDKNGTVINGAILGAIAESPGVVRSVPGNLGAPTDLSVSGFTTSPNGRASGTVGYEILPAAPSGSVGQARLSMRGEALGKAVSPADPGRQNRERLSEMEAKQAAPGPTRSYTAGNHFILTDELSTLPAQTPFGPSESLRTELLQQTQGGYRESQTSPVPPHTRYPVSEYVVPQAAGAGLEPGQGTPSSGGAEVDQRRRKLAFQETEALVVEGRQAVPLFAITPTNRPGVAAGNLAQWGQAVNGASIATNGMTPTDNLLLGAIAQPQPANGNLSVDAFGEVDSDRDDLMEFDVLGQNGQPVPPMVPFYAFQTQAPLGWRAATLSWEDGEWYFKSQNGDRQPVEVPGTEIYAPIEENDFLLPTEAPLSTFGLDVDTASYANVRRFLMEGRFPPPDAVRIEELVNYFAYNDSEPADDEPLAVQLEAAACPWNTGHRLVRIGLKAKTMDLAERPPTTLVFLVDTSGSMRDENKLPLVKQSLRLLIEEMTENDRIAIVTYSTAAGLLLDSTSGEHQDEIIAAIAGLQADGSTNGEAGLKLAYEIATKHFIKSGQNRVILCTDGDFNVGTSATDPLVGMISEKRASGVFLSICGYGTGNIKDEKLERIADKGNGLYHYIDNLKEARKVFLDELTGTLYTVAKDVKLQVEFNPQAAASYRLIGYENRTLAAEDFNNDRIDSGDMGAGHSVTALYEVAPMGTDEPKPSAPTPGIDPLKYRQLPGSGQPPGSETVPPNSDVVPATKPPAPADQPKSSMELLTVKLRYKQPDGETSVKREFPLVDDAKLSPSDDLEWSAAVASFGMLLRSSRYAGQSSLDGILELAQGAKGRDESGRRREFIDLVLQTQSLVRKVRGETSPEPQELSSVKAREKATVGGKYDDLLDKLEARGDAERYGSFHDYGWSTDPAYAGREGLPAGYWVYVFPDWYIWGENVSTK